MDSLISARVLSMRARAYEPHLTDADRKDTCVILRSAERFMAVEYPGFPTLDKDPVITDKGDRWEVYYQYRQPKPPSREIILGFGFELYLDKQTLKVVDHVVYQP